MSRRDLAHQRATWLATGGVGVAIAIAAVIISVAYPTPASLREQIFAGLYGLFGLFILRREPPAMDDAFNHVVLLYASSATILGLWVFQPGGGEALASGLFVGPLIAVRLQDRRYIAAHMAVATGGLVLMATAGAIFGFVDVTTVLTALIMTPAIWVLGLSCMVVLEASEQQGEELERLVRRDPLTGVGNRRLLDEQMAFELARHARTGQQLSVITLDLNGFKALNDTLGHAAGDELLRDVATALTRATRREDTVVRQGGDEFVVLLPNTIPAHAQRTVNAIRAGLATSETGGLVSSGFGIATYPDDALTADVLLHVADERLIANKEADPTRRTRAAAAPAGDRFAPAVTRSQFDGDKPDAAPRPAQRVSG